MVEPASPVASPDPSAVPRGFAELHASWRARWEDALATWSRFTKLTEPRWCFTKAQEKEEKLEGSFAMIRLVDHAVVISLRQVREQRLEGFAREILAHEIGHHVYTPADLRDNARLLVRIRAGLPGKEAFAGLISNLYTDLLINDRLQRSAGLDMAGVYRTLRDAGGSRLWSLYLRMYEVLWSLPSGDLVAIAEDSRLESDAGLGARVVRAYSKDWLEGAGRFACLCFPYLESMEIVARVRPCPWIDADQAGEGGTVIDGLSEIEEGELDGTIHPAEDPEITGISREEERGKSAPRAGGRAKVGGRKNAYRSPSEYTELLESLGVKLPKTELVARYYRERAIPYLIPFPAKETPQAMDPLPEGLDLWDVGSPVEEIDWTETVARSPVVVPGVTTVRRTYGVTEGSAPERSPPDLYIGIDCSGSMSNPAAALSYPVLAGTILALSALRAGAQVMACLSGEPGRFHETEGFLRDPKRILGVLTGYLGTGYAFGILRLESAFLGEEERKRPAHVLVVSDHDMFHMLNSTPKGWEIAEAAVRRAGGGGTFVLEIPAGRLPPEADRMRAIGWNVHTVNDREELVAFARAFSRETYGTRAKEAKREGPFA